MSDDAVDWIVAQASGLGELSFALGLGEEQSCRLLTGRASHPPCLLHRDEGEPREAVPVQLHVATANEL